MADVSYRGNASPASTGLYNGGSVSFIQDSVDAVQRIMQDKLREFVSVYDFVDDPATVTNWRDAVDAAMTRLADRGGGTLYFPAQVTSYDIDNTGAGAISWTSDGIWWLGASATASVITNVSTDGTDLFSLNGDANSIQRCGWRNLQILSESTAGHIWTFAARGISFSRWENVWIRQEALGKSIMTGTFAGSGGMFENQWNGGIYEHGTGSGGTITAATVPAFDFTSDINLFTLNKWQDIRCHQHGSLSPFFSVHCTDDAPGNKKYLHQNEWRGINVEIPRRGFIKLRGVTGSIIEDITFYDLGLNGNGNAQDGHMIELVDGSGARHCEYTRISKVSRNGAGSLAGVNGTNVSGTFTASGDTVTVTATTHGREVGQRIYTTGDVAGRYTVLTVADPNTLTFEASSPPGSGSIVVYEGAMDIKLDSTNELDRVVDCGSVGGSDTMEVDANGSSVRVDGHRADLLAVYRGDSTISAQMELGGGDDDLTSALRIHEVATNKISPHTAACVNWGFNGDIYGLNLLWLTTTTLRIEPGRCRSDDDTDVVDSLDNETIDITVSGAAGLDTGVIAADTMYDVYLLWDSTGSANRVGIAVISGNDPVMPAQRDKKRRVGSFSTNGLAQIRDFTQYGSGRHREVWYNDTEAELRVLNSGSSTTLANASLAEHIPVGARAVTLSTRFVGATAGNQMFLVPAHHLAADWAHLTCQVNAQEVRGQARMATSIALNVGYYVTNAADDAYLYVVAYEEYL